jgi:hypothetical protein
MKSTHYSTITAAFLSIAALQTTPALAQRVFVAAQGADANPCTFALPCRTFQHAHDVVAAGGEIDVLDPAGYGALTITKAISIQGHGFSGISVASGGTGITVAADATDAINLNGLLVEGSRAGWFGIRFNSGKSLVVENCVVRNMLVDGLKFSSNAATLQTLSVSDSYFTDSGNNGIFVGASSTGAVTGALERVALYANVVGLNLGGGAGTGALTVAATDSVAANNISGTEGVGFFVQSVAGPGSITRLVLTRSTAVGNGTGVKASGSNSTLRLTQSTIAGNLTGFSTVAGGVILSYGDNSIDDNGGNVGVLGSATKQ